MGAGGTVGVAADVGNGVDVGKGVGVGVGMGVAVGTGVGVGVAVGVAVGTGVGVGVAGAAVGVGRGVGVTAPSVKFKGGGDHEVRSECCRGPFQGRPHGVGGRVDEGELENDPRSAHRGGLHVDAVLIRGQASVPRAAQPQSLAGRLHGQLHHGARRGPESRRS